MSNINSKKFKFSIIIPAYNEKKAIDGVLQELKKYLKEKSYQTEIIVVNDGSTDQTNKILERINEIELINHPYNKGYGAAIKTGVEKAKYNWIIWYDSDGQHKPEYIEELIKNRKGYDMIIGARQGYKGPAMRQPGKKFLQKLAQYLIQNKIPDLNSGFRLIKKSKFKKFTHLFPNGFSISTTITLAFFKQGFNIKYIPITIKKRLGKSSVKANDGFKAIMLILRMIILFSPLRIFLPLSSLLLGASILSFVLDILFFYKGLNVANTTILLFVSSLFFFFFGLLTDQISAIRRELKMK